jgi:hypothetical protein
MNKVSKTILISTITVFGIGILLVPSTSAQAQNLVVQFEQTPLFNEINFLPGDGITRWVKVTNNSNRTQAIATEAIHVNDADSLGDVLNLEIKKGELILYDDALSEFFGAGEFLLSNLAGHGAQTQYDFKVSFDSATGNPFQGKTLGFDILIGFQGTEGIAGGGGGGTLPAGLTINEQSVRIPAVEETSVTITWSTSYNSTSQVIYAAEGEAHTLDLTDNTGTPPKYGYAHTTPEYDTSPMVTFHSVTIYGLSSGTTYYYRTVSHASLAISREFTFTTTGVKGGEVAGEEIPLYEGELPAGEVVPPPPEEEIEKPPEEIAEGEEGLVSPEGLVEAERPVLPEERPLPEIFATEGLLAAMGAMPFNWKIILIIAGVIIIGLIILWLIRRRRIRG